MYNIIMSIEGKIFQRYSPDFNKLEAYGFKNSVLEKLFKDDSFKAVITVNNDGKVSGTVYDLENDDEFLPLRVETNQGAFVGEVRAAYEELLEDIRDNCFSKKYYIYPQSNRITNLIISKYKDEPEFLWKTTPGTGVFRNPATKKWYLAILDIDRSKIQEKRTGLVEIALIKLAPENVEKITQQEHFYEGYHMNKKHWITVILDDSVSDEKIMELIHESYIFTEQTKKK